MALLLSSSTTAPVQRTTCCARAAADRPAAPAPFTRSLSLLVAPQLQRASGARPNRSRMLTAPVAAAPSAEASTVRIIIQGRNVEVTPALRDYVEKKIANTLSFSESVVKEVDVKLRVHGGDATKGRREQRCEMTVYTFRNGVVRVEDAEDNMYAAIDKVTDKLWRKMKKMKEKALPKGKWPGHKANVKGGEVITQVLDDVEVVDELPVDREPQLPENVIRAKYFYLDEMAAEDAVDALEAVGHDFYLYTDKDTGSIQVLYKRKSGGYGVIIPQVKS